MLRIAKLLAIALLAVGVAYGQNGAIAPYASGSASASSAMGYKNPDFSAGAGVESSSKYLLLDAHGSFNSANFKKTDNGYAGTIRGSGYYKFFGHFLGGAGANWSANTGQFKDVKFNKGTFDATRQSAHPFVGGGFQFGKVRVIADYNLPGKDALTHERVVEVNSEIFATKHFRITQAAVLNSYVDGLKSRVLGSKLSAGVKFVL